MWVWGEAAAERRKPTPVPPAAVEAKTRQELLKEAVRMLLASGEADRVGVWVESIQNASEEFGQISSFRGILAGKEGDATPAEWSRLSPEPPWPAELLVDLQSV